MKRFESQFKSSRLGKAYRRLRKSDSRPNETSLHHEMEQGAVIGFFASSILALHFAGPDLTAAILIFGSTLGLFLGAVIGAILWIGTAKLPEEPILTPSPGQDRRREGDRRR